MTKFSQKTFLKIWRLSKKVSWFQLFVYIFSKKMWNQKYLYSKQRNPKLSEKNCYLFTFLNYYINPPNYWKDEIFNIRWMDYENNGMFWHHNKKFQNFHKKLFWKFDVSVKKSADFSCLFTFFLKNVNSKKINAINCEIHNYWKKIVICLHFWITT